MTVEQFKACESLLDECIADESVELVMHNYFKHFEEERRPIEFEVTGRRQDGSEFPATLLNVPIAHDGEFMLLCFIHPNEA
jgi:hypothetical protein